MVQRFHFTIPGCGNEANAKKQNHLNPRHGTAGRELKVKIQHFKLAIY